MTKYILISGYSSVSPWDNTLEAIPEYLGEYDTISDCKYEVYEDLKQIGEEFADMKDFATEEERKRFIDNYLKNIETNDNLEEDLKYGKRANVLTWDYYDDDFLFEKTTYTIQKIER